MDKGGQSAHDVIGNGAISKGPMVLPAFLTEAIRKGQTVKIVGKSGQF